MGITINKEFAAMKQTLIALSILILALIAPPSLAQNMPDRVSLYRLYNAQSNDHFYTSNYSESLAAANSGYRSEGVMGELETTQTSNNKSLFRLYSAQLNNHFYTASTEEVSAATGHGFRLEGVIGYMPSEATELQVYRLYNSSNGDHFYTTNYSEGDRATSSGYTIEDSLGYLFVPILTQPPISTSIPKGAWGSENLSMNVQSSAITLQYSCASGSINQPVVVDAQGNFTASGTYTQQRGGPAQQDETLPTYPVRYIGHISGNSMTLTVSRTDVSQDFGTYQLQYGQTGNVPLCV